MHLTVEEETQGEHQGGGENNEGRVVNIFLKNLIANFIFPFDH